MFVLSAEVLACADLRLRRVGTLGFSEADGAAAGGKSREREMTAKLAWVEKRVEFHCKHWNAFEEQFIHLYVQRASSACNMVVDERLTDGANVRGESCCRRCEGPICSEVCLYTHLGICNYVGLNDTFFTDV